MATLLRYASAGFVCLLFTTPSAASVFGHDKFLCQIERFARHSIPDLARKYEFLRRKAEAPGIRLADRYVLLRCMSAHMSLAMGTGGPPSEDFMVYHNSREHMARINPTLDWLRTDALQEYIRRYDSEAVAMSRQNPDLKKSDDDCTPKNYLSYIRMRGWEKEWGFFGKYSDKLKTPSEQCLKWSQSEDAFHDFQSGVIMELDNAVQFLAQPFVDRPIQVNFEMESPSIENSVAALESLDLNISKYEEGKPSRDRAIADLEFLELNYATFQEKWNGPDYDLPLEMAKQREFLERTFALPRYRAIRPFECTRKLKAIRRALRGLGVAPRFEE